MRDISEIFASNRGFLGVGLFNDFSQIPARPTLVAMATKCELKLAITLRICEISPRSLGLTKGFGDRAIE